MKNRFFRVTGAQKRTLAKIRLFLAEKGYLILDVAPRFKRKKSDFLAITKGRGTDIDRNLIRLRPTPKGRISVQGFGSEDQYIQVKSALKEFRKQPGVEATVYWHHSHLPYIEEKKWLGWYEYFTKAQLKEVLLFIPEAKNRRPFS